jgi:predicted lactoylglutathione lyase
MVSGPRPVYTLEDPHLEASMTTSRSRKLFINLPVSDLKRSIAFFTKLGFSFDAGFTDENATCMIVSEQAYVMLLVEKRFKDFTKKQICDTKTSTEALFSFACDSRAEVDELVKTAIAAGGSQADEPQDHGFMYDWGFYDPDGHGWGVFYMDPSAIPQK